MEKIDSFIEKLYGNGQMMQFYLILGAIALFFTVLIIITLIQSKNDKKASKKVEEPKEEVTKEETINPDLEKEEAFKKASSLFIDEIEEEEKLTDTQIFNNILMNDNNTNYASEITPSPVETPSLIEQVKEEPVLENDEYKPLDNNFYVEKDEINPGLFEQKKESTEEKTISELFTEPTKTAEIKPLDIEDSFPNEELPTLQSVELEEVSPLNDPPQIDKPLVISDDEIESRLAALKASHDTKVAAEEEDNLTDLMKAAGLEDTIIIPEVKNEESRFLGR